MTSLPDSIRDRFPIVNRVVYANSCSQGALSLDVRAAYEQYLSDWDEKGAPWELWVEQTEGARDRFARLLNASPDEIAVTTSVSAGVSSLVSGLGHPEGRNEIVISDYEFPTIGQITHAQEMAGGRSTTLPPRLIRRSRSSGLQRRSTTRPASSRSRTCVSATGARRILQR